MRNRKWVNGGEPRGHHITTAALSVAWLPVVAMVETIEARAELDTSGKAPIRRSRDVFLQPSLTVRRFRLAVLLCGVQRDHETRIRGI